MPKKPPKKTARHGIKFFAKQTILVFRDVFLMLTFIATILFGYIYFKTPAAATLLKRPISQTTIIYDRTGEHILYEIHGEENRKVIPHEQIPAVARIATIAAEDDSFYEHHGIDFFSVIRALKINLENNSIQQGGSTITQQLARNALLTRDKTIQRKLAEITLAIKIERKYSKDQILDMYFNEIPYGSNTYGIEVASETFFGKKAEDLTWMKRLF
jgi:membrane peptidoglycan carboxypeptidase